MIVEFNITGEPRGKQRPKFSSWDGKPRTRTPEETVLYENRVIMEYRRQCGTKKFADGVPLEMSVTAYYAIPMSKSKKKRADMESGVIIPTKKPDVDNVLKIIADSLNGVAYRDDSQIAEATVRKFYGTPRVEVIIQDLRCMT